MKKILMLILGLVYLTAGIAQHEKTDEQWYSLPANKKVTMNLKFASNIKVQPTTQAKLGLRTILTYQNEEDLKIHQMQVKDSGGELSLVADLDMDYLNGKGGNICWNCEEQDCVCFKVAFVVLVPKDAQLNLETISGDIEIPELSNSLKAKSISGFIDIGVGAKAQRQLALKSVTGEIYTDFELKLDKNSTSFSKTLNGPLNGGGPLLALETISGDIYFRKK